MLRRLISKFQEVHQASFDAKAAVELSKLGLHYVPWTQSALAPSTLIRIVNDIIINKRRTIVEFGSGISSVYIARILMSVVRVFGTTGGVS